jgi:hypothetical protein
MNRKQRREMMRKMQNEDPNLEVVHPDVAGLDIGNESHYVALDRKAAERFWEGLRSGIAVIEAITLADLEVAWDIGVSWRDQDFSIVDRTSRVLRYSFCSNLRGFSGVGRLGGLTSAGHVHLLDIN